MRIIWKITWRVCLVVLSLALFLYGLDDLWSRLRGRPVEHMTIGLYYAAINHWNEVEYSVGTPVTQTCVDALLPHFGYTPCWYLRRHTIQKIGP